MTLTDYRFVVGWKVEILGHATAIFRQVNKNVPMQHHDALEFPDGRIVLLTISEGQEATVLQLPALPKTAAEADAQKRVATRLTVWDYKFAVFDRARTTTDLTTSIISCWHRVHSKVRLS